MNQSKTNRSIPRERTLVDEIGYGGKGQCIFSVNPRYLCPMNCHG
jgi:hypothetical protein